MGIRFRKSFGNLFRINISKSGIGYSVGVKGVRYTKTAQGRNRTTLSLPGTGLAYITETSGNGQKNETQIPQPSDNGQNHAFTVNKNEDNFAPAEKQDFVKSCERYIKQKRTLNIWFIVCAITIYGLALYPILLILKARNKKPKAIYEITSDKQAEYEKTLKYFTTLKESSTLYEILASYQTSEKSSAASNIQTGSVRIAREPLEFLETNCNPLTIELSNKRKIYILPDNILLREKNELKALSSNKIGFSVTSQHWQELRTINDSQLVGTTWEYINKDGSPDRRYSYNPQKNIYNFALVKIYNAEDSFNLMLLASNLNKIAEYIRSQQGEQLNRE